jgi:hypothetical protein
MSDDNELPRRVVLLTLVLILLLVLGWVALAIVMKMEGYPDDNPMVRFKPVPIFMREHGPWTLWVPMAYFLAALVADRAKRAWTRFTASGLSVLFFCLCVAIFVCFLGSAARPYSRGLLIDTNPAPTQGKQSASTAQ